MGYAMVGSPRGGDSTMRKRKRRGSYACEAAAPVWEGFAREDDG